ncbi:unnamed protein product [Ranitomeya imitator]|uniref:VWFA domain-containing protein n=1 Tax=Ranitomeya imitator TaxID=111125 RepID=A0ABN9LSP5_9NEOB|nr:unnamed protein product [Ranitomeya imitator]
MIGPNLLPIMSEHCTETLQSALDKLNLLHIEQFCTVRGNPGTRCKHVFSSGAPGSLMSETVAMLNFYPSFPAAEGPTNRGEFIFVVDRSGSMECPMNSEPNAPQRIQSAKETLVLLLKSLPLGCYFNIFGFGSHFESFFTESKEYTQQSMEEAVKMVNEMSANFGGTEILRPLKKIYDTSGRPDHPRQLFLFTDGEVGNTKEVIDEVQKNSNNHRCFTFGIGEGASTSLIKGMARAGSGIFEFITGKDRMQTKVLRALKCSLQPTVNNVSLTWSLPSGVEAILLSKVPNSIFQGQKSIVYAQVKGKVETEAEGEVCLQYNYKDELLKNAIRFPLKIEKVERFAIDHYQFVALPFGLATAPRVFTKVMAATMDVLHSRGIVVVPYLDDLIKAPTFKDCELSVSITTDTLSRIG